MAFARPLVSSHALLLWGFELKVKESQLKEGLISVGSTRSEEPDPLDPEIIQRLDNKFKYRDMPKDYYVDEDGDEVSELLQGLTGYESMIYASCWNTKLSSARCEVAFIQLEEGAVVPHP